MVKDHIDLTLNEEELFELIHKVVEHFDLGTVVRVSGGWVRDKLLGIPSNDIDIALDNTHGLEFCNKVNDYLSEINKENVDVCFIPCNPKRSKHLETTRMRLNGREGDELWIDFVNLRSEEYNDNTRIPTMDFGTPKVDAERRDLTINSLFYNVETKLIEDFTGRGIADLKSGKIVTPLPPMRTFLDDPLRVLRAIRFGARFGFVLDEELKKVASDEEVKAAIDGKISRERIGREVDLVIFDKRSGNQPVKAMASIADLGLFWTVFRRPPIPEGRERSCVDFLDSAWSETIDSGKKGKKIPVVDYIIRDSLKLKNSDAETVISLHTAAKKFVTLIPSLVSKEDNQAVDVDWKRDIIDVPIASKLRILTGLLFQGD
ncbi:hypothetical protein K7X08_001211 [Anisodus acutangulus]|uniref:Poly A polymerase head domain-containing protein n=1 Tax=Anisodus acutangulus TaxID=402998 RepID=A0A9Q1MSE5_9SOLA|nr:hypothetical protein K7X08_001211 [Anisodus acutangulus]